MDTAKASAEALWPFIIVAGSYGYKLLCFAVDYTVYGFVAYGLYQIATKVYKFYQSLIVQGKPNEWVVVINNGEMKQAGIGLNLIRSLNDQVAIFPS